MESLEKYVVLHRESENYWYADAIYFWNIQEYISTAGILSIPVKIFIYLYRISHNTSKFSAGLTGSDIGLLITSATRLNTCMQWGVKQAAEAENQVNNNILK